MTARAGLLIAIAAACGGARRSHMYPAGSDKDDGYGDLAQKSARLLTSDGADAAPLAHRHHPRSGDPYGGDPYGGAIYGDTDAPAAPPPPVRPQPRHYRGVAGLTGSLEGTIRWPGAPPPSLTTACGPVAGARIAANRAVAGVLVTIEHVDTGRLLPSFARPLAVGGTIAKRGCVLAPTVQIVTPLPAGLAIHGDATAIQLRVTSPTGVQPFELAAAGRVLVPAQPGVTRIEADDGSLAAAWVIASDAPYYAITDDDGRFRIDELAAGSYDVMLWRPPVPSLHDGKLVYGAPVTSHRTLTIDPSRPTRLDVVLDR